MDLVKGMLSVRAVRLTEMYRGLMSLWLLRTDEKELLK